MEEFVVNKAVYSKLQSSREIRVNANNFNIVVDSQNEFVRFVNEDVGSSLTLFSKPNTMRYISYTVDSIMSEVISKFGYQSKLHRYMDGLLKELNYIK